MQRIWGRKGHSREESQQISEIKKDTVFKWLQKGWYIINLELLEAGAGQLSNKRFWDLVKELMPHRRQKKDLTSQISKSKVPSIPKMKTRTIRVSKDELISEKKLWP